MDDDRVVFWPSCAVPSCHAATIVETGSGDLLAAWFAGTREGHPDVAIWLARYDGAKWGQPLRVVDEPGVPLWNPVLFRDTNDVIWLFYKVAPTIPAWTGAYIKSTDEGSTWTAPSILPAGLLGPAKNKPVLLSNGDILCGTSAESWRSWACWVETTSDGGKTWSRHGPITAPGDSFCPGDTNGPISASWDEEGHAIVLPQAHRGVIQPAIWECEPGNVSLVMRSTASVGAVCMSHSEDCGRTWSAATTTDVPCPNSGLDAVRLDDGRVVLACNPTHEGRTPLSLLVSADNGVSWPGRLDLETEQGEYSYPSIIQATDGMVHVVYTYRRTHIVHQAFSPEILPGVRQLSKRI